MGIVTAVFALLVGLVTVLTGYAFGGISRAVDVLQSLTRGDLNVVILNTRASSDQTMTR